MKRGFTLHEIIISLTVMSGVLAVGAHFSTHQLRFLRTVAETQSARTHLGEASAILEAVLANAHATAGDIQVAEDSTVEVRLTIGVSVVCSATPGRVIVPRGEEGSALAGYEDVPQIGDRLDVLFADSTGATWLTFSVTGSAPVNESCAPFQNAPALALNLAEPITLPTGAPVRLTHPLRLSHYRSSDGRWYLGGRDWNGTEGRFNAIQPLAGPLLGREGGPEDRGLIMEYLDSAGNRLAAPISTRRIATVRIVVRASPQTGLPPGQRDSLVRIVALRR